MSQNKPIVYIVRDIERALGKTPDQGYFVTTNSSVLALQKKSEFPNFIDLIETKNGVTLDTVELMEQIAADTKTATLYKQVDIVVFKNTPQAEAIAKKNGWSLLNPRTSLAEKIEPKISQVEWLGELAEKYLPKHAIKIAKEMTWNEEPIVIQWDHGHTGESTTVINSAKELKVLQDKFPERPARVSAFVKGPSFTVNVVVADKILIGNISYQITGIPPFTDNPFTTIGNDWGLTHSILTEKEIEKINEIATAVGEKMKASGWKGLFGIDVMRDDERDQIVLIEINARQPASTSFESILQQQYREQGVAGMTVFEAHLAALTNQKVEKLIEINDGSQIVQRVTKSKKSISAEEMSVLQKLGYNTIQYENTVHNTDLLRIQSERGVMETHGKFNKRGKEVVESLVL